MPPIDNPELALVLAGVPDSLAQSGGDLYATIINVAVNAWMAGHIHGEDSCPGCDGSRGPAGTTGRPGCAPSPRCSRPQAVDHALEGALERFPGRIRGPTDPHRPLTNSGTTISR